MELVRAVRARQLGEFDADGLMLVLLGIAADARDPLVVAAHFLGPRAHHRLRNGVGSAQRVEIGDRLVDVVDLEVALARDACVAAIFALGCLLQQEDLRAEIVRRHSGGRASTAESDDDNVRFLIPFHVRAMLVWLLASYRIAPGASE